MAEDDGMMMEWEETEEIFLDNKDEFEPETTGVITGSELMELIMMEVDEVFPNDATNTIHLVIVPDTNIFIHSLEILQDLLNKRKILKNEKKPEVNICYMVVLPWTVLQELDKLRRRNRKAQLAINYINELLVTKHPHLRPQKPSEMTLAQEKFQGDNEDDSILQCALFWSDKISSGTVVFITNDKNLRNKSMVINHQKLIVCDGDSAIKSIQFYISSQDDDSPHKSIHSQTNNNNSSSKFRRKLSAVRRIPKVSDASKISRKRNRSVALVKPLPSLSEQETLSFSSVKKIPTIPSSFSLLKQNNFKQILELIKDTIDHIIKSKMKEEYGEEGWMDIVKIRPPWTLETGLKCMLGHWIAVFSFVFGRGKENAEELFEAVRNYNKLSKHGRNHAPEKEEEIIELSLALLNAADKNKPKIIRELGPQLNLCKKTLLDHLQKSKSPSSSSVNK